MSGEISTRIIDRVAMLVRQMTPVQRKQLLELAPDLRRDARSRAKTQVELANYFEGRMGEVLPREIVYSPLPEKEFLGPYTLDEFCVLPENEQVRRWDQAHVQAWEKLSDIEYPLPMIS